MSNTFEEKLNTVLAKLTAFSKTKYLKADIESELRKLQQELLVIVFDEEHARKARLTIWDVYNRLERENAERGGIADELLTVFKEECKTFNNLIRAEISGNWGETQTMCRLSYLNTTNKILRNVQLVNEDRTSELDIVVFTKKAAFILEIKNTKKNVLIDESGDYYRLGEYTSLDCNLKSKMDFRETLFRRALAETMGSLNKDMKVVKLVVFTNKYSEIQNKCKELQSCVLAQLPYLIEDFAGRAIYTEADIEAMAEAVSLANNTQEYEFEMDMQRFKEDFATLLVTLENAEKQEECIRENEKEGGEICTKEVVIEEENYVEESAEAEVLETVFVKEKVEKEGVAKKNEEVKEEDVKKENSAKNKNILEILGWASGIAVAVGVGAFVSKALVKR